MSQAPSAAKKPWADFHFIRGDALLNRSEFSRCQDCTEALVDGKDIEYPLLVSHRWKTAEHPDPDGTQLYALQQFVNNLADVALVLFASPDEQREAIPSLAVHGVLQAAILAARFICIHNKPLDRNNLLRRLGLWYDYACLPQKPRTETEQHHFKASLKKLPDLFSSAPMLTLRQNDVDDYMSRGWCLAELASADLSDFTPISLYVDTLGKEIPLDDLMGALTKGNESGYNTWIGPAIKRALCFLNSWGVSPGWRNAEIGPSGDGPCTRTVCESQTDTCQVNGCCLHSNFGVWCSHCLVASQTTGKLTPAMVTSMDLISAAETSTKLGVVVPMLSPGFEISGEIATQIKLGELEPPFDYEEVLKEELDSRNIYCTNGSDILKVGAWLLRAGSFPEPNKKFFLELHERALVGKNLTIVGIDLSDDDERVEHVTYAEDNEEVAHNTCCRCC